ncbi:hypothetical protein E3N88_33065 [Mikania micrantha]|uniref:Uncharacterized protein n=1 Tax=Mikania micrantha TaxID=192012 RepID=A0A5N6MA66_9ASTR|nr:hypothetical protein E3N88_33065 [Mikania micrantha]
MDFSSDTDYIDDCVAGRDLEDKLRPYSNDGNASLSSFCDSKGFGPVLNDGLSGVGQSQPIVAVNFCPTNKHFQRRKKGNCLRWGNHYGPAHKCPRDTFSKVRQDQ